MFAFCWNRRLRCSAWMSERIARCDRWRMEWRQRCDRWRQLSTRRCDRWRTEQQRRCDRWRTTSERRCDRWEQEQTRRCSSWGIFSFICVAFTVITTWVCRAFVTVVSTVCDLWVVVTSSVCDLWTTIVSFVCDVFTWVGSLVCDVWTFFTTLVCRAWVLVVDITCGTVCWISRLFAPIEYSSPQVECIYAWTARYRIDIDPRECTVRIVLRIRLVPATGVTAADIAMVQARWEPAIEAAWSNRFAIILSRGNCECRELRAAVDVQFVTSGEHHVVNVRPGSGRADMGTWFVNSSGGTAAHEAGHMFGNPDEYVDNNCPMRTVTSDGSIMQNSQSGVVKARHYSVFSQWATRRTCCEYAVETKDEGGNG